MSMLQVKLKDNKMIEIHMEKLTQFAGLNNEVKDYIFDSLAKYFSSHRYLEEEELQTDNIRMDGEIIGRGYYETTYFYDIRDIEEQFTFAKNCLLRDYLMELIDKQEISNQLFQINLQLQQFMDQLNIEMQKNVPELFISTDDFTVDEILKKKMQVQLSRADYYKISYMNNFDKYILYLEMLEELDYQKPNKRLLIFRNLDMYLKEDEYQKILNRMDAITNLHDWIFIIGSSLPNYCFISERQMGGINIINDDCFFVESLEKLKIFVEKNYPYERRFRDEELIEFLGEIIHDIGREIKLRSIESQVIFKEISIAEFKKVKSLKSPNLLELEYIQNE